MIKKNIKVENLMNLAKRKNRNTLQTTILTKYLASNQNQVTASGLERTTSWFINETQPLSNNNNKNNKMQRQI